MKGTGFGGIRFQQKIGFTLRIKKSLLKGIQFGGILFQAKQFSNVENMPVIECIHFGAIVCTKKVLSSVMKGIQLGALWSSQNGLQCWDHVCHKRHPSSVFWGASFPRKKCFNVEDVFTVGGWGPDGASRFSQKMGHLTAITCKINHQNCGSPLHIPVN